MVYLDYSATTPLSDFVLDMDKQFHQTFYANPNSIHQLGQVALDETKKTSKLILETLKLNHHDVIYTSGATESNNLALKGYCEANHHQGNHIITTPFEHGSITATLNYLAKQGYVVDVVEMDKFGRVDLDDLAALIHDETILVSIGAVNSELGIVQDIKAIRNVIDQHTHIALHSDMTQAIGKVRLDYGLADMISLSAHKIYGFKGIGALIVRHGVSLLPIIHGGKSLSHLRPGTPPISLIHSLGNAIKDAYLHLDEHIEKIQSLKKHLIERIKSNDQIVLNSNQYSIPHIVNLSYMKDKSKLIQSYLSDHHVYVSTTSACSSGELLSRVVLSLTDDKLRASTSLRISLSHLTTEEDIDRLIDLLEAYDEGR